MKTLMKILALVMAMAMVAGCLAACGGDANTTEPEASTNPSEPSTPSEPTTPSEPEPSEPVDDGKVEYKVYVKDADGNPVVGVWAQICKDGSCFTPVQTDENGCATFRLVEGTSYYGYVSGFEDNKVYFEGEFEIHLVHQVEAVPPVAE